MRESLGLPSVPNSPKPIFRMANENQLLAGKIENWLEYAQIRVSDKVYLYDQDKCQYALKIIGSLIRDLKQLKEKLST